MCQQRQFFTTTGLFHHDDKPFKRFKVVCILSGSVDLKLTTHNKTWNVIKRKFFIFHFNKIGKIKGQLSQARISAEDTITHNTCSK